MSTWKFKRFDVGRQLSNWSQTLGYSGEVLHYFHILHGSQGMHKRSENDIVEFLSKWLDSTNIPEVEPSYQLAALML